MAAQGIYGVEVMVQCKGKKLYNAPCGPHVYGTAEKARRAARHSSRGARPRGACFRVTSHNGPDRRTQR